jgi:glycosyltransferase involved in cell wall biosynthesis
MMLRLLAYLLLVSPLFSAPRIEKPIVILTTSYKNHRWVRQNIESIFAQDYKNYRVIYVDDASPDGTADAVQSIVDAHPRKLNFELIRNRERIGALANIYYTIHNLCADEEIIVNLDGDDWFYDNQVLKKINAAYLKRGVWLTHGTLIEYPAKVVAWSRPIPRKNIVQNTFRQYRCPSHLRTFYAWLFKKIKLEDLLYNGQFFTMTWDQAMMFPMIEMAGLKHEFIPDITYVYNMSNPINDYKVDPQYQRSLEAFIRSKTPYEPLEKLPKRLPNPRHSKR